jgi:hypothetical protein
LGKNQLAVSVNGFSPQSSAEFFAEVPPRKEQRKAHFRILFLRNSAAKNSAQLCGEPQLGI